MWRSPPASDVARGSRPRSSAAGSSPPPGSDSRPAGPASGVALVAEFDERHRHQRLCPRHADIGDAIVSGNGPRRRRSPDAAACRLPMRWRKAGPPGSSGAALTSAFHQLSAGKSGGSGPPIVGGDDWAATLTPIAATSARTGSQTERACMVPWLIANSLPPRNGGLVRACGRIRAPRGAAGDDPAPELAGRVTNRVTAAAGGSVTPSSRGPHRARSGRRGPARAT